MVMIAKDASIVIQYCDGRIPPTCYNLRAASNMSHYNLLMPVPNPSPVPANDSEDMHPPCKSEGNRSSSRAERQPGVRSAFRANSDSVAEPSDNCRKLRTRLQTQLAARRGSVFEEPLTPTTSDPSEESDIDEGKLANIDANCALH